MPVTRKKKGLITREKPDYRDYLRKEFIDEGFQFHPIELQFGKGFPDIVAVRLCTWFLELKWLRNVSDSNDPKMYDKLLAVTTELQKRWLNTGANFKIPGKQIYGIAGGYYEEDVVKTCFLQFQPNEKIVFVPDFDGWATLDKVWAA